MAKTIQNKNFSPKRKSSGGGSGGSSFFLKSKDRSSFKSKGRKIDAKDSFSSDGNSGRRRSSGGSNSFFNNSKGRKSDFFGSNTQKTAKFNSKRGKNENFHSKQKEGEKSSAGGSDSFFIRRPQSSSNDDRERSSSGGAADDFSSADNSNGGRRPFSGESNSFFNKSKDRKNDFFGSNKHKTSQKTSEYNSRRGTNQSLQSKQKQGGNSSGAGSNSFFARRPENSQSTSNDDRRRNSSSEAAGDFLTKSPKKSHSESEEMEVENSSQIADSDQNANTGKPERKPFDKKKWRLQKYSLKYKKEQWDEKKRLAFLHKYHKDALKDHGADETWATKVYKEMDKIESESPDGNIENKAETRLDTPVNTGAPPNTRKLFKKPMSKFERIKEEKRLKKEEFLRRKAERDAALKKYKQNKIERFRKINKMTKKGQPVMKGRMELLLEKIQKSLGT